MLYLKKLSIKGKDEALNIEEAIKAIKEGREVMASFSENMEEAHPQKLSFTVDQVVGILEVEGCFIIKTAKDGVFPAAGWDDNKRSIELLYFYNISKKSVIRKQKDAEKAVNRGHKVIAVSCEIQTSPIKYFVKENLFETETGSLYEIV